MTYVVRDERKFTEQCHPKLYDTKLLFFFFTKVAINFHAYVFPKYGPIKGYKKGRDIASL